MSKAFVTPAYTFTPGASGVGTVALTGIDSFDIKRLVAVINQTRGVVIYATGSAATRYTALAGSTLTLNVDTSTHNSGDVLQVIYDSPVDPLPSGAATNATLAEVRDNLSSTSELIEAIESLRMAVQSLNRSVGLSTPDTGGRLRVLVDAITSGQAIGTVGVLTNQTAIGNFVAADQIPSLMHLSCDSLRRNITVS